LTASHREQLKPGLQELSDVVSGLEFLLSLASDLTLRGPGSWWEEAKEHHPLLLVQALMTTAMVCLFLGGSLYACLPFAVPA
jgi:hypothetical protein